MNPSLSFLFLLSFFFLFSSPLFLRSLCIPNPNCGADATVSSSDEPPTTPPINKRALLSPYLGYSRPRALEKISEKINPNPKQSPYFGQTAINC
ncbi:hypothetical protein COLO4_13644 [Corchorus olitorius]|uniref:Uncharacterized protein n=1 Tax=Corchorus olitorius TaxID=93759 RepID=A0A1R3JVQ8_9ROSI|nr:hypothetical protein COLO4_13644 [Corchorus olitorius]